MGSESVDVPIQVRLDELEDEIDAAYEAHDSARLKLLLNQNQQLCWALWHAQLKLAEKAVTRDIYHR